MNPILRSVLLLSCVPLICAHSIAVGQVVPAPPRTSNAVSGETAGARPSVLRESLPKIIYIFNDDGELVPWIGSFPWSKYDEIEQLSRAQDDVKFVVKELLVEAEAKQDHAIIVVTMHVRLLEDGRQVIPIKMGSMHFSAAPKSSGKPVFAQFNQEYGEYELLVEGEKNEDLEVRFESNVLLHRIGLETHLRMSLPRVPISSLTVSIPETDVEGSIEQGIVTKVDSEKGSTKLQVRGLPHKFDLSWQPPLRSLEVDAVSFEVEGQIDVHVDALGSITSDAVLAITSFNHAIEHIVVKLPEYTRWSDADVEFGDYEVTPLEVEGRRALQIVFAEAATKPAAIRLSVKAEKELSEFELAGFEVVDAISQFGEVSVYSQAARQLSWTPGPFARRVESSDLVPAPNATFEYSRPNQIRLSVSRQSTELVVEPIYEIVVDETRAMLTAIFQCSSRGASPANLTFDMGPWTFQSLGRDPDNVVRYQDGLLAENGKLELPLVEPPDRFDVSFTATLTLDQGLAVARRRTGGTTDPTEPRDDSTTPTRIRFSFPTPENVSALQQSTVAIATPSNVLVDPRGSLDYIEISLPERVLLDFEPGMNPVGLRMRSVGPPPPLSVVATRLERITEVLSKVEIVDVDATQVRVRQDMSWRISDVGLPHALLTMSNRVLRDGNLKVAINGEAVDYTPSPTFGDYLTDTITVQVPLETMMAAFDMTLTYSSPRSRTETVEPVSFGSAQELDLDLVLPKRSASTPARNMRIRCEILKPRVAGYQVSVSYARNAALKWPWKTDIDIAEPNPEIEAFVDPEFPTSPSILPLTITQVEEDVATKEFEELVDRAWFQTWYTDSTRTDRAVFRVQGGDTSLRVAIPKDVRKLNVFVDGRLTEFRSHDTSTIEVDVDATAPSHVLELQYARDTREPPGILETQVPRIEGADILGQWYWHIVMPRNECLIAWPRNLTRAHVWDWSVLIPRRKPELTLENLEDWSGATKTGARVLAGSAEYLFGAMGETEHLSVRTTRLPIYVLVVAGGILVLGLMLIYLRQRILVLLVIGVLIGGLIFLHPSYASIAGQVAVLGILLVAVASLLTRFFKHLGQTPTFVVPDITSAEPTSQRTYGSSSVADQGTTTLAVGSSRFGNGESS